MAAIRSGTEANTPRLMALSVISRNQRSTRFGQEHEVEMKCRWHRGVLRQPSVDVRVVMGALVIDDQADLQSLGYLTVNNP